MAAIGLLLVLVLVCCGAFLVLGGDDSKSKAMKRYKGMAVQTKVERARHGKAEAGASRRKQILTNLKAMEKQQRKQSLTLENRLAQAGFAPNVRGFWIASAVTSVVFAMIALVVTHKLPIALGAGFAAGLGLPRWVLGFLSKRRLAKFTAAFPDATDVIVRGIKSGLPVNDCLKIIAAESPRPLNEEFVKVVENISAGLTIDQCMERLFARMPTSEVRFFSIVLAIQQKTGGNLAEALNNLSVVLRARKLMKEKIKAMSGEAVASAGIIGVLPPAIMILVGLTTPAYMAPMFTDPVGHIALAAGAFWMGCGILVMRKMINFKF